MKILGLAGNLEIYAPNGGLVATGTAGAGKDTFADVLVKNHEYQKVSLADPLKRICRDVFDFSDAQLWGPSEARNEVDMRYVRFGDKGPAVLTPRYALQTLGTEWGRDCYENIWVDYALRTAQEIIYGRVYTAQFGPGLRMAGPGKSVVIPDVRFKNEVERLRKAGGKVIQVRRKVQLTDEPTKEALDDFRKHASEEVLPPYIFDDVYENESTIEKMTKEIAEIFKAKPAHLFGP